MPVDRSPCLACGAPIGGRAGCQGAFDALNARAWEDLRRGAIHRIVVDAYCLQHPDEYCRSAKSYAAHLAGLCCGIEHGGDPRRHRAIARWLDGRQDLARPVPPAARGAITVEDASAASDVEAYVAAVRGWAVSVWDAYEAQHALARRWLEIAGVERSNVQPPAA